jgi:hypothetical protein
MCCANEQDTVVGCVVLAILLYVLHYLQVTEFIGTAPQLVPLSEPIVSELPNC